MPRFQGELVEEDAEGGEGLDAQDVRGAGGSILKALTLGHGDELVGAVRTGMDLLSPSSWGEGTQSASDMYKMYRDDARASDKEFAKENPGSNLAIQAGVGILNPINRVGFGAKAGSGLAKMAGRAGAEGAVYGAGEAESVSDIPLEAAKGALTAAGTAGALGGAARLASNRRVGQELLEDGQFTPIHMTKDDNLLTELYRQGLGRVLGASSRLRNQAEPVIRRAADAAESAKVTAEATKLGEKARLAKSIADLDVKAANKAVDAAIPSTMPSKVVAKAQAAKTAEEAEQIISQWWSKNGFKGVKSVKEIEVPSNLVASVKSTLTRNPEMDVVITPALMKEFESLAGKKVSGKQFLEMRNVFARAANKAPSLKGKAADEFRSKFDNIIQKSLGKDSKEWKEYVAERAAWGGKQTLSKSARQARKAGGDLTANSVARAAGDASPLQRSAGAALRQQRAAKELMSDAELKKAPRVAQAREAAAEALDESRDVSKRASPKGSILSEGFTTAALGGAATLGLGPAAMPLGYALGKGLTSQTGQRLVAGQTNIQKQLAKAIREGDMDLYTRLVGRMAAAGQTGE